MEEIDLWRAAHLLIQQHGDGAEREAMRLGGLAMEKGDAQGERVWVGVLTAIKSLMNRLPPSPLN
ncbi:MAG: hypothetical protein J0I19_07360 [Alphaproteobacteria bacterium]|nr:hypothetical protein [Alphaproteobacteria bacterium]